MLLLWRGQQQPITSFVCVCYQTKTRKPTSGRKAYKGLFSVFFANVVFVAVIFWWLFRLFFCLLLFFSGLVTKFLATSDKNIPIYTYLRICTYIYGNWMWLCMCVCGLMYPCAYVCVNNPAAFVVKSPDKNLFLLVFFLYVFFSKCNFLEVSCFYWTKTNRLVWESQVTIHEEKYTSSLKNYNCNWI